MTSNALAALIPHLRHAAGVSALAQESDRQLLARFATLNEQAAFEALVSCYGSLVWGVCWRVLRHKQDAEDAFQATFLLLARKASSTDWGESVGGWLYRAAYHLALKVRAKRRPSSAGQVDPVAPAPAAEQMETIAVLDSELQAISEEYRLPLMLCYLDGKTQEEAARFVGCSLATVKRRLARGRELLQARLRRRGFAPAHLGLAGPLAAVPVALVGRTAGHAFDLCAGNSSDVAPAVLELVRQGVRPMVAVSVKGMLALLLAGVCTVALGTALLFRPVDAAAPPAPSDPQPRQEDPPPKGTYSMLGSDRFRHSDQTRDVAYSTDGKLLVSCGTDGSVCLWDAASGKRVRLLALTEGSVVPYGMSRWLSAVAISADGKTVAAGEHNPPYKTGSIHVWEAQTGKHRVSIPSAQGQGGVLSLALSPDGSVIAAGRGDGTVRLYDADSGKETRSLAAHTGGAESVCFAPDGKSLASSGSADGKVQLWDIKTGDALRSLSDQRGGRYSISFSSDGKLLASVAKDGSVGLFDPQTGKERKRLDKVKAEVGQVAISPDGKTVVGTSANGQAVYQWSLETGKLARQLPEPLGQTLRGLAVSPDGKTLALACGYFSIQRYDLETGKALVAAQGHRAIVRTLHVSPDGGRLVSSSWDWSVRVWDLRTGRQLHSFLAPQADGRTVATSPDGKLIAMVAMADKQEIIVREADSGKERVRLKGHSAAVVTMAFAPGGKTLASCGEDRVIRVWDLASGKELLKIEPDQAPRYLAYCGEKYLASAGAASVTVYEAATGKLAKTFTDAGGDIHSLAGSPDGRTLAGGSTDSKVYLWDVATRSLQRTFTGHTGYVGSVAFAPDGRSLAVGAWGGVWVWETQSGVLRHRIGDVRSDVRALSYSPDGRTLIGANDSAILLWDVTGRREATGKLAEAELTEESWKALGDKDGVASAKSLWALVSAGAKGVGYLDKRLESSKPVDADAAARLIEKLGDDDFDVAAKAQKDLRKLGRGVVPHLQKALEKKPPVEVALRLRVLLADFSPAELTPEGLLGQRAVEALERIGSPEARRVLERLAKGAELTRVTEEAAASLARMKKAR